jgi:anti-sigma-K factor RskA
VDDPDPELAFLEAAHPEAAGWVLGTLDPDDAEWFAGHLPTCPDCRAAVADFGPTVRLLATAVPADLPPPGLQARTLAGVAQAARQAQRNQRWRGWSTRMLALAAAVIVAAGVSLGLLLVGGGTAGEVYAFALHSGTGSPASASGTARQADSGWSVQLTADHLAKTGPGQFYQCWWVGPGHLPPVSAGTFTVGASGSVSVQMSTAANPDDYSTVEITLGSAARPGQPGPVVLSGTVADDD